MPSSHLMLGKRNYKALKITACKLCLILWARYKKAKNQLPPLRGVRSKSWEPRMVLARGNTKAAGRLPEPAVWPDPPMHPTLICLKNQSALLLRANKSTCYLFLLLHPIAQVSVKSCLNSFCGVLPISVD